MHRIHGRKNVSGAPLAHGLRIILKMWSHAQADQVTVQESLKQFSLNNIYNSIMRNLFLLNSVQISLVAGFPRTQLNLMY